MDVSPFRTRSKVRCMNLVLVWMRRVLALLLLATIGSPLILPALANAHSDLPACCRRDGKHHCAMQAMAGDAPVNAPAIKNFHPRCPLFPKPGAVPANSSAAVITAPSRVAPADRIARQTQLPSCGPVRIPTSGPERKRGPPPAFS